MRFTRLLAFATWVVVALLAVAAFSAFSPPGTAAVTTTTTTGPADEPAVIPSDIGAAAGRQAAFGFSQELLTLEAPATTTTSTTTTTTLAPTTTTTSTTTTTTTNQVAVTTTTYPRPTKAPLPPETVYALVAAYFQPEDVERAVLIVWCESRYDANAVNPSSRASGLFQHIPRFWSERSQKAGWAGADIFDPEANTAVAAWLRYSSGDWKHWYPSQSCWGNGNVTPPGTTTTTTTTTTTVPSSTAATEPTIPDGTTNSTTVGTS